MVLFNDLDKYIVIVCVVVVGLVIIFVVVMLMGYNVYLGGEKIEMDGKRCFFWILIEKYKKVCVIFIFFFLSNMFIVNIYDKK